MNIRVGTELACRNPSADADYRCLRGEKGGDLHGQHKPRQMILDAYMHMPCKRSCKPCGALSDKVERLSVSKLAVRTPHQVAISLHGI